MDLTIRLTGIKPMLQHNGRLANPLDPHTRAIKAISKKRSKTDDDLAEMALLEARGSMYETDDGLLGIPNLNVWRAIYDAAKAFKLGEDVKRALLTEPLTVPLLVADEEVKADMFLNDAENLHYCSVKIQRVRTMRARPLVRDWSSTHMFELLTDVIDLQNLGPVLERAGRLVGLGDWRPMYGTFSTEVIA